mgnify:CR=1 FL=1
MKDIATGPLTRHGGLKVVEAPFRFTKYQEDFIMEKEKAVDACIGMRKRAVERI